jgi:hypothetical protein
VPVAAAPERVRGGNYFCKTRLLPLPDGESPV